MTATIEGDGTEVNVQGSYFCDMVVNHRVYPYLLEMVQSALGNSDLNVSLDVCNIHSPGNANRIGSIIPPKRTFEPAEVGYNPNFGNRRPTGKARHGHREDFIQSPDLTRVKITISTGDYETASAVCRLLFEEFNRRIANHNVVCHHYSRIPLLTDKPIIQQTGTDEPIGTSFSISFKYSASQLTWLASSSSVGRGR